LEVDDARAALDQADPRLSRPAAAVPAADRLRAGDQPDTAARARLL